MINPDILLIVTKEITNSMHHLLLTSPEMCLDHPPFMKLMHSAEFTKNLAAVITDETHCISQWGNSFCKWFSDLRKLRLFVPVSVLFLATSATLTLVMLAELKETLHFDTDNTFLLNLGNDRPNITLIACLMCGATSDLSALDFVADEAFSGDPLGTSRYCTPTHCPRYSNVKWSRRTCQLHYHGICPGDAPPCWIELQILGICGPHCCLCSQLLSTSVKWLYNTIRMTQGLCSQYVTPTYIWMPGLSTHSQRPPVKVRFKSRKTYFCGIQHRDEGLLPLEYKETLCCHLV
jgi:hypothetical protein